MNCTPKVFCPTFEVQFILTQPHYILLFLIFIEQRWIGIGHDKPGVLRELYMMTRRSIS